MDTSAPLAERMRPKALSEYIGQEHLTGPEGIVRKIVRSGNPPSMIFWGPPGTGKTTLAEIIANTLKREFYLLSAINSGVKEIREIIDRARKKDIFSGSAPVLFVDEIHRFSKSQQDSLLGAIEKGWVVFIGATTENPSFEVIQALLSRSQVFVLNALNREEVTAILEHALREDVFLKTKTIHIHEFDALVRLSGGDARKALNALELVVNGLLSKGDHRETLHIYDSDVLEAVQQNLALYDKKGEQHYDIISAFIKSVRGSDPNAAVYWLARMIDGGEDLLFMARRLVILASEDIGNADPMALVLATSCFQAVSAVGMPEARIILSQVAVYLSNAQKSNASYSAIGAALDLVRTTGNLPVPLPIRNAPTRLMKELGYGDNYHYAHGYENNFYAEEFLPESIKGTKLYEPGKNNAEDAARALLAHRWKGKYSY